LLKKWKKDKLPFVRARDSSRSWVRGLPSLFWLIFVVDLLLLRCFLSESNVQPFKKDFFVFGGNLKKFVNLSNGKKGEKLNFSDTKITSIFGWESKITIKAIKFEQKMGWEMMKCDSMTDRIQFDSKFVYV
jgi:hypothetical protein